MATYGETAMLDAPVPALDAARRLAREQAGHGLSYLALRPGHRVLFSADGEACLGYTESVGTMLALGPPTGPPDASLAVMQRFRREAARRGLRSALCGVPAETARQAKQLGYHVASVGDEALVDPADLDLRGKRWREVRAALNRAGRRGLAFEWAGAAARCPGLLAELGGVSEAWLAEKRAPEMRFALGSMASVDDEAVRLGVARDAVGRLSGFVTWAPAPARGGWMLELLRFRPGAMAGLSDFLVASSLLSFQAEGVRHASLSGTPLAGPVSQGGLTARALLSRLCAPARPLYDYRGLRHFKAKFNPRWEELFVAYEGALGLPRTLLAVARACAPNLGLPALARAPVAWARSQVLG